MKIYLDNCCYNRPFDDQKQERVYLESEAILVILKRGQRKEAVIIGSAVIDLEIERMKNENKKLKVRELYEVAEVFVPYSEEVRKRSQEIMEQSQIRSFDSLHITTAEAAGADVMLTTDDKLEKMAFRLELKIKVMNPLRYIWEVF